MSRLSFRSTLLAAAGVVVLHGAASSASAATLPLTLSYGVTGAAEMPTLVRGSLPLKGGTTLTFSRSGGDYLNVEGALDLGQATVRLVSSGFIPVTARVGFIPSGPATGVHGGFAGTLLLHQRVRIKVLAAKMYGSVPLPLGNSCQSKQLTDLNLADVVFSRANGGELTGTFKISDLNGCGSLNGLVSSATASDANTMTFTLAPA